MGVVAREEQREREWDIVVERVAEEAGDVVALTIQQRGNHEKSLSINLR